MNRANEKPTNFQKRNGNNFKNGTRKGNEEKKPKQNQQQQKNVNFQQRIDKLENVNNEMKLMIQSYKFENNQLKKDLENSRSENQQLTYIFGEALKTLRDELKRNLQIIEDYVTIFNEFEDSSDSESEDSSDSEEE